MLAVLRRATLAEPLGELIVIAVVTGPCFVGMGAEVGIRRSLRVVRLWVAVGGTRGLAAKVVWEVRYRRDLALEAIKQARAVLSTRTEPTP